MTYDDGTTSRLKATAMTFLQHLAGDDVFNDVISVNLADCKVDMSLIRRVSRLRHLKHLRLSGANVDDQSLAGFFNAPFLEMLSLDNTRLSDVGMMRLPALPSLSVLCLDWANVTGECLPALKRMPRLEELSLMHTSVDDRCVSALATLPSLKRLYLDYSRISDVGLQDISRCGNLRLLGISGTDVSATGVKALQRMPTLKGLIVRDVRFTDDECRETLETLSIVGVDRRCSNVTDFTLREIAKVHRLAALYLSENPITDAGVEFLCTMPRLNYVDIRDTLVTRDGYEKLKRALGPDAEVFWGQ